MQNTGLLIQSSSHAKEARKSRKHNFNNSKFMLHWIRIRWEITKSLKHFQQNLKFVNQRTYQREDLSDANNRKYCFDWNSCTI
jgi:hypothetical protein